MISGHSHEQGDHHSDAPPTSSGDGRILPPPIRPAEAIALREEIASWCAEVLAEVAECRPEMPQGVDDRPADVWEPLLQVADVAGGLWPEEARAACVELVKVSVSREASLGIRLLTDLRTVFVGHDKLSTESILVEGLHAIAESPWSDLRGKPLDATASPGCSASTASPPQTVRIGDRTPKGYLAEAFHDAWDRYLPRLPQEGQQGQQAQQGPQGHPHAAVVANVADVAPSGGTEAPA